MIWSLQAISTFRKLVTNIQLNFKVRLNTLNMLEFPQKLRFDSLVSH